MPALSQSEFVKGELTSLGATKLQLHNTRIGVRAGADRIGSWYYLVLSPELDLQLGKLGLGLGVPLRVPAWDSTRSLAGNTFPEGFAVRSEDYDELSEFARVLRHVTYGRKEETLYLKVGTEATTTLGHGAAMRRYLANVDVDRGRVSAELDFNGRYGGFEAFVGDVLRPDRLFGALAFLRPFGFADSVLLQRLSIGATYAADMRAPWTLARDAGGLLVAEGGSVHTPKVAQESSAQLMGISVETKLVRNDGVDIKPWVDVTKLVGGPDAQGGAGLTLGALGRFSFGGKRDHAIRAIVEARAFEGNYLPGYFDTFYEIQRFQFITGKPDTALATKLFDVVNRKPDLQTGWYFELQYAFVNRFALTGAWEDSTAKGGRNVLLHLEVPTFSWIKFFATAHRRSVEEGLLDIGSAGAGQLEAANTAFFAGARVKLLPVLFVNARAYRAWQMDPGRAMYVNVDGFQFDVEGGFEFSRRD